MRTKLCWIPFIPVTLLMMFLKYMETTLSADAEFMGLDIVGIRYAVIILAPVLFVLCMLISLFDKKTAPFYSISRNIGAAIFSFVTAVAVMFKSVMSIMNTISSGDIAIIELVTAVVGIVAGIAILFMSSCHLSGKNYTSSMGVLMLFPALWAAFELIIIFLSYTTVSVLSKDMLDLICFAIISLFFFTDSMVLGNMEGKNPVKRCFIFGMPAVSVTFSYAVYKAVNYMNSETFELGDVANTVSIFAIGAYALFLIIELTVKANRKDDVVLVDEKEETDEYEQTTVREEVNYLINEYEEKEPVNVTNNNRKEFILNDLSKEEKVTEIPQIAEENKFEEIHGVSQTDTVKAFDMEEKNLDLDFVIAPKEEERKIAPKDELEERMDQIDKLIFEIQSKQGKND